MKKFLLLISIVSIAPIMHAMEGGFDQKGFLQAVQGSTQTNDSKSLMWFISQGADVNGAFTELEGKKPIQQAVMHKNEPGIRLLRLHGARITNTADKGGFTVSHWMLLEPKGIIMCLMTCPTSFRAWSTGSLEPEKTLRDLYRKDATSLVTALPLPAQKKLVQLCLCAKAELVAANTALHLEELQEALREKSKVLLNEAAKINGQNVGLVDPAQVEAQYGQAITQEYERYFTQ